MDNTSISSNNVSMASTDQTHDHIKHLRSIISSHRLDGNDVSALEMLTLPADAEPVRFGNTLGSVRTAIANPRGLAPVKFPTSTTLSDLPMTEFCAVKFPDVLRSVIYSQGLGASDGYGYAGSATQLLPINAGEAPIDVNLLSYAPSIPGVSFPLHGQDLFTGQLNDADPHCGILATQGDRIGVKLSVVAAEDYRVIVKKLEGVSWQVYEEGTIATGATSLSFLLDDTGYYALTISSLGAAGYTITTEVSLYGNGAIYLGQTAPLKGMAWAQRPSSEVASVLGSIQAIRVNSSSLMYTNRSNVMSRSGVTTMRQLPNGSNFFDYVDNETLASFKDSGTYSAVLGAYVFRKPTHVSEFELKSVAATTSVVEGGGNPVHYKFNFYGAGGIIISVSVTDPNGHDALLTYADSVEWQSTSQWLKLASEFYSTGDLEKLFRALTAIPQYHTNDFHLSDIWEGIKGVASDIWSGIKEVGTTVAPVLPYLLAKNQPAPLKIRMPLSTNAFVRESLSSGPPKKGTPKAAPKKSGMVLLTAPKARQFPPQPKGKQAQILGKKKNN